MVMCIINYSIRMLMDHFTISKHRYKLSDYKDSIIANDMMIAELDLRPTELHLSCFGLIKHRRGVGQYQSH